MSKPITILMATLLLCPIHALRSAPDGPAASASSSSAATADLTWSFPAFPGAEGAGAYTPGGRGGKVLVVTTLADYLPGKEKPIPGSLRVAVETKGPRIVVFRVAGNIDLRAGLQIAEPFITIAGQSAPGGGICLRYYSLDIKTHDVVLRHLRVRPGDTVGKETDAISSNGRNVIIDHCSASFGIDETISTNGDSGNVTVQWCLITESLNESVHHKGGHGYGSLISGTAPITYHHNLYAFHRSRNPRPGIGTLDFRNNVIAGWGDWAGYCGNDLLRMNYVNNHLRPADYSEDKEFAFRPGGANPKIFITGNIFVTRPEATLDNALLLRPHEIMAPGDIRGKVVVASPFPVTTVATDTADVAFDRVLKEAGATLPARDACDSRVTDLVRRGEGRIINSQKEVGGWPELKPGEAPPDADLDGMPDEWEKSAGLNPADPADAASDLNGDGFTSIEKFLNGLDPRGRFEWIYPPRIEACPEPCIGTAEVTLAGAPNGKGAIEIRHTLDGAEPGALSPLYTAPIQVHETTMVRARAFVDGKPSHVTNRRVEVLGMREPVEVADPVNGVDYTYYENGEWRGFPDLETLKPVRNGVAETIGIGPSDRADGYGLRFNGYIRIPADDVYTFYLRSNELSYLKIGGEQIAATQSRKREASGRVALRAGLHAIEAASYFPKPSDGRTLEVSYEGPGIAKQVIPASMLFRANDAREAEEAALLATSKGAAWREGKILFVLLDEGRCHTYADFVRNDVAQAHRLAALFDKPRRYLIRLGFYEGGGYLLGDPASGIETRIDSVPTLSPDKTRFVTASMDVEAGYDPNRIQIWKVAQPRPELEWSLEPKTWGPVDPVWNGDTEIAFTRRAPSFAGTTDRPEFIRLTEKGWVSGAAAD